MSEEKSQNVVLVWESEQCETPSDFSTQVHKVRPHFPQKDKAYITQLRAICTSLKLAEQYKIMLLKQAKKIGKKIIVWIEGSRTNHLYAYGDLSQVPQKMLPQLPEKPKEK